MNNLFNNLIRTRVPTKAKPKQKTQQSQTNGLHLIQIHQKYNIHHIIYSTCFTTRLS